MMWMRIVVGWLYSVLSYVVISLTVRLLLGIEKMNEDKCDSCSLVRQKLIPAGSLLLCMVMCACPRQMLSWQNFCRYAGYAGFMGCLLAATIMDLETKTVYRYVWVAACGPMAVLLGTADKLPSAESGLQLAVFILLQQLLFSHMYGKADCHAFCCCAAVNVICGGGFAGCMVHMVITFILLCLIQILKKNVTLCGTLKIPVAMLPYITVGFCGYMLFCKRMA